MKVGRDVERGKSIQEIKTIYMVEKWFNGGSNNGPMFGWVWK